MDSAVSQAIIVHGTDDQRARLLRESACVGFSEPEHGSDVASIETRGDIVGDEIFVTGVKTWVAHADVADSMLVLCRLDASLSCVLLPLDADNLELRPIRQMTGDNGYFEVRMDGAGAPLDNVIGGLGNGWRVAMTVLECAASDPAELEREFWDLVDTARRCRRDHDPVIRQQLAWAYGQVRLLRHMTNVDSSVRELMWREYHRRLGEIALDVVGPHALLRPDGEMYATSRWQHAFLSSRADTIASGTSEVQRNMIAERVLGLPK